MTEYIAQTTDNRNISYMDDDPDSVKRRAEYAGHKVTRVVLAEKWDAEVADSIERRVSA